MTANGTTARLLFGVLLGALVFLATPAQSDGRSQNGGQSAVVPADTTSLVERGRYLTTIGDCIACHTTRNGEPFAGGRMISTPYGDFYAPNITPDPETGIGKWDFADFWQALNEGKGPDGTLLYPVFPYTSYTRATKADARAIFAYLQSLPAVRQQDKPHQLHFPYGFRSGLRVWRSLYFEQGVFQPDPDQSEQWNRGAYLVQGLGHCQQCHTPRNALGGLAEDESFHGGEIPAQYWYAPDLSMQEGGGLEGWTQDDIVQLLKTGISSRGAVIGPMAEVVRLSTRHMTREDLEAIAVYLQSLPPRQVSTQQTVEQAPDYALGGELYAQHCAGCHGKLGQGVRDIYPPLDGNASITGPLGVNAVRIVLLGGFPPATPGNPMPYSMPPFAARLNDTEIAAVVNYIRQSWSNNAAPVTAADVQTYRNAPVPVY